MNMTLPNSFSYSTNHYTARVSNEVFQYSGNIIYFQKAIHSLVCSMNELVCPYCNKKILRFNLSVDHLYPESMGGPWITDNLLPCCKNCNNKKDCMTYQQYMMYLDLLTDAEKIDFRKEVLFERNQAFRQKRYQFPDTWILTLPLSMLEIPTWDTKHFSKSDFDIHYRFYRKYHFLRTPITVDKNMRLLDGLISVKVAQTYKLKNVPVIYLTNVISNI